MDGAASPGMEKRKSPSVKHLAFHRSNDVLEVGRYFPPLVPAAIGGISDHRMTHGGTVNPNLMGSSRFQIDLQKRNTRKGLFRFPMGLCWAPPAAFRGHLFTLYGMAANRQVDAAGWGLRVPVNEG